MMTDRPTLIIPYLDVAITHPAVVRVLAWFRVDLRPARRQPSAGRLALATVAAVVLSLVGDAAVIHVGTTVDPATVGYPHFRFSDYARLTVVGVLIAAAGWPVVTRLSSAPVVLYAWLALATTVVLFAPDAWLLINGVRADAVVILMVMHIAVAVATYGAMVMIAPVGRGRRR